MKTISEHCKINIYINDKIISEDDFCLIKYVNFDLRYYEQELLTKETCLQGVNNWGGNLEFVPEKLKTYDICKAAVSNYGLSLRWVPEELKTDEICNCAVIENINSEQYAPIKSSFYNNYLMRKALL